MTGAGGGIGRALAVLLAARGAAVGAFDIDGTAVEATAARIIEAGGRALALAGDTRSTADVTAAVDTTVAAFGRLDGLAPVAGVMRPGPLAEVDTAWPAVMETNVLGPLRFARASRDALAARGGAIVLMASVLGYVGAEGTVVYSASKGAIISMTAALAVELAPAGIRVNAVAPGCVRTDMLRGAVGAASIADAQVEQAASAHLTGRLIEPEEIARVCAFLLSEEAAAITGSCQVADAGMLARMPS